MKQPWTGTGFGWVLALVAGIIAFISLFIPVTIAHLPIILIILLALAIIL